MKDFIVTDKCISDVVITHYDIAFFAIGYEDRSRHLLSTINPDNIAEYVIVQYPNVQECSLVKQLPNYHILKNSEDEVYSMLNKYLQDKQVSTIRILIDYSSMGRAWYAAIINWARYIDLNSVYIDMVYCIGNYDNEFTPLKINQISTILGHEGVTSHKKTVAVFGLGFDRLAALCVIDKIEPDVVLSFIASTMVYDYQDKAKQINDEFLKTYSQSDVMYFPIDSVEKTYRLMSELILVYLKEHNVLFVPMGPKPHILATILLSTKYPELINLYVQGRREPQPQVRSTDKYVCTNISFDNE